MKMIKKCAVKLTEIKHIILILVFSAVSSFCLFMKSDDFVWYYIDDEPLLAKYRNPNGRYFANMITHLVVKSGILRFIFVFAVLSALLFMIARLINFERKSAKISCICSLALFLTVPCDTYAEVINWFSGFTNYVMAALLIALYMLFVFKIAFMEYTPPKYMIPIMAAVSVALGLCLEHISIYNVILTISMIFVIKKLRGKFFISTVISSISAVVSLVVMLMNENYGLIMGGTDSQGTREFVFSLNEAYTTFLVKVMQNYTRPLWLINIIISAAFLAIYIKDSKKSSQLKYGKLCMGICLSYAVYSVFTSNFSEIALISDKMKLKSLECSFNLLYLVAIVYLAVKLLNRNSAIRCCIYILSSILLIAPFIVISPYTARCSFESYFFWILLAGEIFIASCSSFSFFSSKIFQNALFLVPTVLAVIIGGIDITNYIYNFKRIDYFREQLGGRGKTIDILEMPYPDYQYEFELDCWFDDVLGKHGITYGELYFRYYDIPIENIEEYSVGTISDLDYNL